MTEQELREAIDRIGRTADGELLYLWLQKKRMIVLPTTDPSALRVQNGERILAAELMGLLSQGIEESVSARSDRIAIFSVAGPVDTRRNTGAARRGIPAGGYRDSDFDPGTPGAA